MNQDAFDKAAAVVLQEARARLTKRAASGSWSPGGPTMDYNPDEFNLTAMDPPKPAAGPVRGLPAPAKAVPAPAAPGRAGFGNFLGRFGGLLSRGGLGGGLARLGTGLAAGAGLNALNNYMRPGPVKAGGDVMFGPEDNPERPGESTMTKVLGLPAGLLSAAAVPAGIAGGRYSPPLIRVGKPLVGGALATGAATGLGWLIDKIRNYRYKGSSPAAPVEFGPPEHPSRPGEHTYRNWLGGLGLLGLTPVGGIAGAIGGHFIDKSRNQDYQLNPEQWHGTSSPEKAAHALLQEARYRLTKKAAGDVMFGPEDNPERPGESTLALGGLAGGAAGATVPDMLRNATSQAIPAGEIRNPGMAGSVPYGKDTNVSGMYRLPIDNLVERMNPSTLPKFRSMSLTERLGLVGDKLLGRTVGGPNTDMSHVHPSTAENMRQMHYLFDNGMSNSASLYARDIVPHATMGATGKSPLTDGSYPPYDVRKTIAEGVRHATPAGQEPRRSVLTGRDFFGKIQPKTLMGNISQFGRNLGKSAPAIAASTGLGWLLDKIRNAQYNAKMTAAPEKAAHALLQEARYRLAVKQADMDPALRNALLGAALGGGAGFAYDRLARDPKDRNGLGSAIAGAGLGAAGGAASPAIADALAGALGGSAAGGLTGAVGGAVTGNELRRSGLPASIAAPGGAMAGAPVGGVIGGATGALTGGAIGGLSGFANASQQDHAGAELLGNALGGLVLGGGVGAAHEMTKDKKDRNLLRGAVRGGAIGAAGTAAGTGIGRMLAGGLGGAAGGAVGGGIAGTAAGGVMGGIAGSASDQDILEARAQLERTLQQYRTQHGS